MKIPRRWDKIPRVPQTQSHLNSLRPNTSGNIGLYRPVTIASYVLDWAIWHGHAFPRDLVADYGPNVIVPAAWNQVVVWADLLLGVGIMLSAWALRVGAPPPSPVMDRRGRVVRCGHVVARALAKQPP